MYYYWHLVLLLLVIAVLWPTICADHNKVAITSPKTKSNTIAHTNSRSNSNNSPSNGGIYFSDIPLSDDEGSADGPDDDLEENASGKGEDDEDTKDVIDKEGSGSRPISGSDSDTDDDDDDDDLELGSGDGSLFISSTERPTKRPDVSKTPVSSVTSVDMKPKPKDPITDPIDENRVPIVPPIVVTPETSTRFTIVSSTLWPHGKDSEEDEEDDNNSLGNEVSIMGHKQVTPASFFARPGILAAVIGGAVVGLLCAILLVMFIVYRMRKKDEGSYALDEHKRSTSANPYARGASKELYA